MELEKKEALGSIGSLDAKIDDKLVMSLVLSAKQGAFSAGFQGSVDLAAELQLLASKKGGAWVGAVATLIALIEGGIDAAAAQPPAAP